jgi:hypothetical protein
MVNAFKLNIIGIKKFVMLHLNIQVTTFRSEMVLLSMYIGSTCINSVPRY